MPSATSAISRALFRTLLLTLTMALALALVAAVLVAPRADAEAPATNRSSSSARKSSDDASRAKVRIATFNVRNTLSPAAVSHDIRRLIDLGHPSIIGFQERSGSRHAMRAALPAHWRLVMPHDKPGNDLNPVAFDQRVWRYKQSRAALLTDRTFRRSRGNMAVNQYAVVVKLQNRETGGVVRVANFHMPPDVHNKQTGGPNYAHRDRVEAFWRMAASVRKLEETTPDAAQFVATCDCNVRADLDRTDLLVRGKITGPQKLRTNYDAEAPGRRRSIDYVMTQRHQPLRLKSWIYLDERGFNTDHPGVITRLKESRASSRNR
ncbi:hypothetical protein BH09ACT12_BH09ACT12_11500 [soil metagenome]